MTAKGETVMSAFAAGYRDGWAQLNHRPLRLRNDPEYQRGLAEGQLDRVQLAWLRKSKDTRFVSQTHNMTEARKRWNRLEVSAGS